MARTSEGFLPEDSQLGLSLDRYQEIMHLPICAFNGLNNPLEKPVYQCATIWKQGQRNDLAQHLLRAEQIRERELGYFTAPKYVEDERHVAEFPMILDRKHFIAAGIRATTDIETVDLILRDGSNNIIDPVVVTVSTTVTDVREIGIFYPDEDVQITPLRITISAGIATIRIPRARLVDPNLLDDRDDHLQYTKDVNFLTTVDIKRVWADPTSAVSFVWTSEQLVCIGNMQYPNGSEQTQTAVATVHGQRGYRLSKINVFPATYSNGVWTGQRIRYCNIPAQVSISYKSGIKSSIDTELLTARLAHSIMPNMPCSCPYVEQYWDEDNAPHPSETTTPYGTKYGQVEAWIADSRAKVGQGGIFR